MTLLRGVIFDIDGTLVDSNDAHAQVWVDALAEFGITARFEDVRRLVGMGGDKIMPIVSGYSKDSPEGRRIRQRRAELFQSVFLPKLKPFPGAEELLSVLRSRGVRAVVASSAEEGELRELIKIARIAELIETSTSSSDADRSKPDPDIVQAAVDALGLPREEVVMIGDTPYDIEAAARVGIRTVAFRSGGWPDTALASALAIYDGPADLRAHYESSPLSPGGGIGGRAHPEAFSSRP